MYRIIHYLHATGQGIECGNSWLNNSSAKKVFNST